MQRQRRSVPSRFRSGPAVLVMALLAACGQKGPLYLPEPVPPPPGRQAAPAAPAAAASAATAPR